MKRKMIACLVLLCIVTACILPAVNAAGDIYFTAVNNYVQPLTDQTMPKYFDKLYIPYTFFSSDELGVYFAPGNDRAMLYSYTPSYKSLTFDVVRATVFDQDDIQQNFPAIKSNGLIYVPVYDVCKFFGLQYSVISTDPASVVRFMKGPDNINNPTFYSLNRNQMQIYYDAYTGTPASPGASPPPTDSPDTGPTYEDISIFLSFFELNPKNFAAILTELDTYLYKSCFFVSADEIPDDADLLRQAAANGHMIGIWLKSGTFGEYQEASSLLFEAAKIKTILVSAVGDAAKTSADMASAAGLVFWRPTRTYDASAKVSYASMTGKLTVLSGNRESINIACTDKTASVMNSFLFYLADKHYAVKRITEKTPPPQTPSA